MKKDLIISAVVVVAMVAIVQGVSALVVQKPQPQPQLHVSKPVAQPTVVVGQPIQSLTEPSDIQPAGGAYLLQTTKQAQ